ncbi:MAG: Lrp/AsnC family transcriptional regulator [Rhodospirillales bacterium]|nr:Lrp/AsnC family transcriptional regulator [Rhodospirillales bacterium]
MALDAIDRNILNLLQANGRMTNADLAERVHLSQSACLRRVRSLEAQGVIDRYVALIDPAKIGRRSIVFVEITVASQSDEVLSAFEAAVRQVPDVMECHLMSGDADYLLLVMAADVEDYARIHKDHLARLPGVSRVHSSFVLRTVSKTTVHPM